MVCPTRIRACEAYTHNSTHIHECTQISLSLSRSLSLSLSLSHMHVALSHPTVEQCRMGDCVNKKKHNHSKHKTSTTANIQHALRNTNPASSQRALEKARQPTHAAYSTANCVRSATS
jgi:hypothetical protein